MKRPMVIAGAAALFISVIFQYLTDFTGLLFFLFVVLSVAAALLFRDKIKAILPVILIVLLVFTKGFFEIEKIKQVENLSSSVKVEGTITSVSTFDGFVIYDIKSDIIDGKRIRIGCSLLDDSGLYIIPGDKITVSATLTENVKYRANGTGITLEDSEILSVTAKENIYSRFYKMRSYIHKLLFDNMPYNSAAMLMGIVVGDKSAISEETLLDVKNSGVSHIIVVSGMHLAVITRFFLNRRRKNKKYNFLMAPLGILAVTLLVLLTGATPSVLRAAVTYYIIFIGMLLARRPDALSSLFTAAIILVVANPFIAGNLSFQLSAAATFGVLAVSPVLENIVPKREGKLNYFVKSVFSIVTTSLSATIMTLPFVAVQFGEVSVVSVFANIFITHISGVALIFAFLGVLASPVAFISRGLLFVADMCARFMNYIIRCFGNLPFAVLETSDSPVLIIALWTAVVFITIYCILKYDKIKFGDKDARFI